MIFHNLGFLLWLGLVFLFPWWRHFAWVVVHMQALHISLTFYHAANCETVPEKRRTSELLYYAFWFLVVSYRGPLLISAAASVEDWVARKILSGLALVIADLDVLWTRAVLVACCRQGAE